MLGLVINGGSSSIKIAVFENQKKKWHGSLYFHEDEFLLYEEEKCIDRFLIKHQKQRALKELLGFLKNHFPNLDFIGHRIVHGGKEKKSPLKLTKKAFEQVKKLRPLAPLHQPLECLAIEQSQHLWPKSLSYAVFDTSYFHTLCESRFLYPLSSFFEKKGIRKFGFHGINHESCVKEVHKRLRAKKALKVLSCHLGGGCSIAASLGKKCIDTTMGFTPFDGLMMGTRPGSLDPGISLYLLKNKGCSLKELEDHYLYNSGLKGVSGLSSDYRILLKNRSKNPRAQLAIEMFQEHLVKGILSMMSSLKGCDVLVFTGGIAEHEASLRQEVIKRLNFLGFKLNVSKNRKKNPFIISDQKSSAKIVVLTAEEENFIAKEFKALKK